VPRVVFDTVIFVRALINPHSVCGRLVFQHASAYVLVVSPPLIAEILEVLHRPELTRRFRQLAGIDLARIIQILDAAEVVELDEIPAISRDSNDDKVLATAAASEANYLVTQDNDLLVLGAHGRTNIVTAGAFLSILEATDGD
jgi:putative PIN family toxin of toxin-antitoxin system